MSCPVCNVAPLVRISVTLGSEQMVLHSCSNCDARWWDDASGTRVSLDRILTLAGQTRRRRRSSSAAH